MASIFIAIDACTTDNGCMQVLKGSHLLGRIDHGRYGEQTGADPERTDEAMKVLELVHCEMEPGEALFFHSNLLHRSDQNRSEMPRLVLICCYNAARNDPYKEHHHPRYTKLQKVPDATITEIDRPSGRGRRSAFHMARWGMSASMKTCPSPAYPRCS